MGRKSAQPCGLDMTPMIDVVFQLIIFFIVTITLNEKLNEDIRIEWAKNGQPPKGDENKNAAIIEINRLGWISMHGAQLSVDQLREILKSRAAHHRSEFPILVRADYRTKHKDVRTVLDVCTSVGVWKIDFVAMKEDKARRYARGR
jgi:biopolymer transport protein ExbD